MHVARFAKTGPKYVFAGFCVKLLIMCLACIMINFTVTPDVHQVRQVNHCCNFESSNKAQYDNRKI